MTFGTSWAVFDQKMRVIRVVIVRVTWWWWTNRKLWVFQTRETRGETWWGLAVDDEPQLCVSRDNRVRQWAELPLFGDWTHPEEFSVLPAVPAGLQQTTGRTSQAGPSSVSLIRKYFPDPALSPHFLYGLSVELHPKVGERGERRH